MSSELRDFLEEVIRSAGQLALDWFSRREELQIHHKSPKDIVSEANIAVEQLIRGTLNQRFPEFGFYGEESGQTEGKSGRWIVDPIDGTVSFTRGQYHWSVSIAVEIENEIRLAAVYAPAIDALYIAEKGCGAFCNGKPIHVSEVASFEDAVMATGFACLRANLEDNNLPRFARVAKKLSGIRVLGSAAFDCCLVADGRLDAFWEQNLNLYDIAAGALIAQEAGAMITDFQGNASVNPEAILVTNGKLHERMLKLM